MKSIRNVFVLSLIVGITFAQEYYFTKSAKIKFKSETPLETIEGLNTSGSSVVDPLKGTIEFGILLKSFIFDRALLQEHFHENYLESNQFPKAVFKGNIVDFKKYKLTAEGSKNVKVNGKLTIHGITKDISTLVEYKLNNSGKVSTNTLFTIIPEDYGIKIPSLVRDKISKTVSISINAEYQKLETKK